LRGLNNIVIITGIITSKNRIKLLDTKSQQNELKVEMSRASFYCAALQSSSPHAAL